MKRRKKVIPIANIQNPVKAIHAFCMECYGGSAREVVNCTSAPGSRYPCPLYPFRTGKNPFRTKREMTEEQKAAAAERLAKAREAKKNADEDWISF